MKVRHKWGPADRHGDQECLKCRLERTTISRARARSILPTKGTVAYWRVEGEPGKLRRELRDGVRAPECKPGTDYYAAYRAERDAGIAALRASGVYR